MRALAFAACFAGISGASADALAAPASCSDAYVAGQHLLREHHLLRAREQLLLCARDPCPRSLQPECAQWLGDVDRAMPTIVFDARGRDGAVLTGVHFFIDGVERGDALDGTAKELDPGEHLLRITAVAGAPLEQALMVREGEKARVVVLEVSPRAERAIAVTSSPERASTGEKSSYLPAIVASGAGAAALGVFAGFSAGGLTLRHDLDACKPHCSSARVDAGNRDWVVADVALGAAAVSLGLATYFFFHARAVTTRGTAAARWGFEPLPRAGAMPTLGLVF